MRICLTCSAGMAIWTWIPSIPGMPHRMIWTIRTKLLEKTIHSNITMNWTPQNTMALYKANFLIPLSTFMLPENLERPVINEMDFTETVLMPKEMNLLEKVKNLISQPMVVKQD